VGLLVVSLQSLCVSSCNCLLSDDFQFRIIAWRFFLNYEDASICMQLCAACWFTTCCCCACDHLPLKRAAMWTSLKHQCGLCGSSKQAQTNTQWQQMTAKKLHLCSDKRSYNLLIESCIVTCRPACLSTFGLETLLSHTLQVQLNC
jgi:hypothetical protein